MSVRIYWTQGCSPCKQTKQWLTSKEVEFEAVELKTPEDFKEKLGDYGYTSVPVVVTEKGVWHISQRLPKLKELLDK